MTRPRIEHDLLGEVEVPADALYGAQTRRAVENFPGNGAPTTGSFPEFVHALLFIKQAAANTNTAIGLLTEIQRQAVGAACSKVVEDRLYAQFPVHYLHGGGGTSANMNANEVIANIGNELLGGTRGAYEYLHPNDHINLNQSTNDVYPTACHLAVLLKWRGLQPRFEALKDAVDRQIKTSGHQKRLARTCLQDAVDITFGDFFSGYASLIERCRRRIHDSVAELAQVNLGGSIIGRPQDVPSAYFEQIINNLNQVFPDGNIKRAENLYDATQNPDDLVAVSHQLDLCARSFVKIGKDIRLLASGPEAGFRELSIPAVQPGSSAMPGKINPVIPEFLIQVCFRIMGNHQMCASAIDHGELDLNVWDSPIVFGILESMNLLDTALSTFTNRCFDGLSVPVSVNEKNANALMARITGLAQVYGYARISAVCKEAAGDPDRIRALLDAYEFDSKGE